MKIVYFYQYFNTPKGSFGTRVYEFAKNWVNQGHDVTVVTSVYAKSDIVTSKFLDEQIVDGIKLKIINIKIDNKQSVIKRLSTFLVYMLMSSWYAMTLKADVVIASSGPLSVGFSGLVAKYLRRRKFIFEVRDLWPEVAIALGVVRNNLLIKIAYWFESKCYFAADHIVVLSPGMKDDIEKRFGLKNITSITNSANIELFGGKRNLPDLCTVKNKKYALYSGNIGAVNNSKWMFDAAKVLKNRGVDDVVILLIGDGQDKDGLMATSRNEGVDNFIIKGLMPKDELVAYVQNAMVSMVPLRGISVLDTSSPNKFFESLASGTPVIQNTQGWMKDFLSDNNIGFTVDPNNPEALADLLVELSNSPSLLQEMGLRAKLIASKEFNKDFLSMKMFSTIEQVCRN